jgi:hypothetical protein
MYRCALLRMLHDMTDAQNDLFNAPTPAVIPVLKQDPTINLLHHAITQDNGYRIIYNRPAIYEQNFKDKRP